MSADEIVWEEPPAARRGRGLLGRGRWQRVAAELQKYPGKWALVAEDLTERAAASTGQSLRGLGCEHARRVQDDGAFHVYARWPEDAS